MTHRLIASVVHRGILKGFQGTHASNVGYILIEDCHTHKLEKIPCENARTIRELHKCYGNVIAENHNLQKNPGFIGQEILWSYSNDGLIFGHFTPIETLTPEDLAIYDFKRFINRWNQVKEYEH